MNYQDEVRIDRQAAPTGADDGAGVVDTSRREIN
jgi:hypothetical protein